MVKKMLPMVLAMAFSLNAVADEAEIKKMMEAKLGTKVEGVTKAGYLGLYEVFADGNIVYTDEKGTAIFVGPLVDGKTMKNVTEERMKKLTAIKFSELPLDRAIKQVRGDGKRVMATFEDPNCGYCKRFEADLQKINNVTIHMFLYPILGKDSTEKSRNIWCAKDRSKAWADWMLRDTSPATASCDAAALARNVEFGKKHKITGTPTLIFADGSRVPGAIGAPQIEKFLAEAKP